MYDRGFEKKKPAALFTHAERKTIQAAVWDNGKEKGLSIVLRKRFKHGDGWKNTDTYFPSEIEGVIKILQDALAFCGPEPEWPKGNRVVEY